MINELTQTARTYTVHVFTSNWLHILLVITIWTSFAMMLASKTPSNALRHVTRPIPNGWTQTWFRDSWNIAILVAMS